MNKKWDQAKWDGGFGKEGINECYIDNIEKQAVIGLVVFQRVDNTIQLLRYPEVSKKELYKGNLFGLPGYLDTNNECYNCYYYEGPDLIDRYKPELIYQWDIKEGPILIWWDHDLGDVVIDNFDPDEDKELGVAPTNECDYDIVCDEVYFYWIT